MRWYLFALLKRKKKICASDKMCSFTNLPAASTRKEPRRDQNCNDDNFASVSPNGFNSRNR